MDTPLQQFLVVNTFDIFTDQLGEVQVALEELQLQKGFEHITVYKASECDSIVLLYEVLGFTQVQVMLGNAHYQSFIDRIHTVMASDFHQEVVGLVESVRPRNTLIPTSPFMQLRRIEVPLSGLDEYLDWRERCIFRFVRKNELVQSFLAFHSVFSTKPGVLFIAEMKGDPHEFKNSFLTPEYQIIIQEAQSYHMKGSLLTEEYRLLLSAK